jgi:uncharacterized protein YbaR (Trm112 family)/trans-aconitate methyltransferase
MAFLMYVIDLEILCCPDCRADLALIAASESNDSIESGTLHCSRCGRGYPIERGIPRFVPPQSYADSFGLQWNAFGKTQMDSTSGLPISRDRFYAETGWTPEELNGKLVLDVGCGAGRFTEVALAAGARVVAIDYSSAVDACAANLGSSSRLTVAQGDIYHLPVKLDSFDYVYCLGVLQHTPDPRAALLALIPPLKRGGRLAVDFYPRLWVNVLWPKYWLRPLTRRMNEERLFAMVRKAVPLLLPFSKAFAAVPWIGSRLRYLVPVMSYYGVFDFTPAQHRDWAILDTFDVLASAYDQPQTVATVRGWLEESGLRDVQVWRDGLVVGRGVR